jgi:S-adenosylmethionine decarboxylase
MNGREWVVEAFGCDPGRLCSLPLLESLFAAAVRELALHPVGDAKWHVFPAPGGITGVFMLAESHLTVHTFPEHGSLCLNLFCCTPRAAWNWEQQLAHFVGASRVQVRTLEREYAGGGAAVSTS